MLRRASLAGIVLGAASLIAPFAVMAHASLVDAEAVTAIRIHATYDTGMPMAEAPVIIYAPDDPARPWKQGLTDPEGRFEFIPAPLTGRWSVQVRQAGHGAMAHLDIGTNVETNVTHVQTQDWLQRVLMVLLVAWGGLGTALFALSRKGRPDASA